METTIFLGDYVSFTKGTLQEINISHLGKRKIIFKMPVLGDMLVPWRVPNSILFHEWQHCYNIHPAPRRSSGFCPAMKKSLVTPTIHRFRKLCTEQNSHRFSYIFFFRKHLQPSGMQFIKACFVQGYSPIVLFIHSAVSTSQYTLWIRFDPFG